MKLRATFRVVEFNNPGGARSYRVTGTTATGRRIRENFTNEGEAKARKQLLEIEASNIVPSALLKSTRLTDGQILDAEHALAELDGKASLMDAARFYVTNYREPVTKVRLQDAVDQFLESKRRENARPLSITNLRIRVGRLATLNPDKFVSDVLPDHLNAFVHRAGRSPVTADNDRRALSGFFTWATKQGFCASNPMATISPITIDRGEPEILTLEQCRRLMNTAAGHKDGVLVPYVTLALFCGIRPTELARLSWKEIDLDQCTVTVGAKLAKMRQRRIVAISDNAMEWLLPHAARRTPLKGANWRKDFDAVKAVAGIDEWVPDILRHTALTCHLAFHEHEGRTAAWAGNSPDIIMRHYKGMVRRQDAEAFWSIRPGDGAGKIVPLAVAVA